MASASATSSEGGSGQATGACPIDHHDADFARGHADLYRRARAHCPVLRSTAHAGFAIVTRYRDIRAVLGDAATFASGRYPLANGRLGGGVAIPPNGMRIGMIEMDPPAHSALRDLLKPWFAIPAIEAAAPRIAEISRWLIDSLIERGECDAVADLARPMPSLLILDVLGLPLDRWRRYGAVLHEAVAKESRSIEGLRWLAGDLRDLVAGAAYDPDGLVAAMLAASLDADLVCELAMMLLFGGTDTTIAAIGHALRHLAEHPGDRARMIAAPEHIPAFVEELLRLHSPSTGVARTVTAPVEIAGERFEPGDRLLCAINSGNRDESVFDDAERFDMDRPKRPQLAFGWGIHACLGQNLARADLRVFLGAILARMPDFEIDLARTERYKRIPLVSGHSVMPMRFTPGRREGVVTPWPVLAAPRLAPL
jgi:cytochrome P450